MKPSKPGVRFFNSESVSSSEIRLSLKAVKQLYTRKKNALNQRIEGIQRLLNDQSVGIERLEETKRGFNAAWEALDTTYDGLVRMHTEDKTQVADMEEKDEELESSIS